MELLFLQSWAMSGSPRCGLGNQPLNAAPLDFLLFICIHLQRFPLYMQARGVCLGVELGTPGGHHLGRSPSQWEHLPWLLRMLC